MKGELRLRHEIGAGLSWLNEHRWTARSIDIDLNYIRSIAIRRQRNVNFAPSGQAAW